MEILSYVSFLLWLLSLFNNMGFGTVPLVWKLLFWLVSIYEKFYLKKLQKLYGPFLWVRFNCLKARATSRRQFTFNHYVPGNSWYSFYRPRKDIRLSRPWSHPVVLNTGPLDWESSALHTEIKTSKRCLKGGSTVNGV